MQPPRKSCFIVNRTDTGIYPDITRMLLGHYSDTTRVEPRSVRLTSVNTP
jgi:hypothetical protein